jgi:hypothetical protein
MSGPFTEGSGAIDRNAVEIERVKDVVEAEVSLVGHKRAYCPAPCRSRRCIGSVLDVTRCKTSSTHEACIAFGAPDQQISLTNPVARSMATSGCGSSVVGYKVQVAVETEHHLIIAHEVTNLGSDRLQLATMAKKSHDVQVLGHGTENSDHPLQSAGVTPYSIQTDGWEMADGR